MYVFIITNNKVFITVHQCNNSTVAMLIHIEYGILAFTLCRNFDCLSLVKLI